MKCNFVVGQKVVCINDTPGIFDVPGIIYARVPSLSIKRGEIYTIREIIPQKLSTSGICIKLVEIPDRSNFDIGYAYLRFTPLKEKQTDISIFNEILNKVNDGNHDNDYEFCLDELYEMVEK